MVRTLYLAVFAVFVSACADGSPGTMGMSDPVDAALGLDLATDPFDQGPTRTDATTPSDAAAVVDQAVDAEPDQGCVAEEGAVEDCDGVDDDCDGIIDEGTSGYDDDGDGYS